MILSMSDNTKCSHHVILSMPNNTKYLYTDTQRVCTAMPSTVRYGQYPKQSKSTLWQIHTLHPDVNNVHSTANPLCGILTHYIQIQIIFKIQQMHSLVHPYTVSSSLKKKNHNM